MSVEEWWGRTFEGRGTVKTGTTDAYRPESMPKMETVDLLEMVRSENTSSVRGLLCHVELRRRENWTARAALVISIIALVVAAVA